MQADDQSPPEVFRLFPTLIFRVRNPAAAALREDLAEAVDLLEAIDPRHLEGRRRGERVFSWQSTTQLHLEDAFAPLSRLVTEQAGAALTSVGYQPVDLAVTEMWANRSDPGAGHPLHTHANSFLSAVYYVSVPESGGAISFSDPVAQRQVFSVQVAAPTMDIAHVINFNVADGDLIIFPSWLIHGVEPNEGTATRVSLAANIMATGWVGTPTGGYELVPPAR